MTALKDDVAPPPATAPTGAGPDWVTDEVLDRLSARVVRAPGNSSEPGIRRYTEAQTVAVQRLLPLGPPPALGVDRFVAFTNAQLRLLRRIRVR